MNRRAFALGGATLLAGGAVAETLERSASARAYDLEVARQRAALPAQAELRDLVRYATLAASGHNTQPWRFRLRKGSIRIEPDFGRRTPVVDPDDHHLFVSLGCAAENLVLAARASGLDVEMSFDEAHGGALDFAFGPGSAVQSELFDAIRHRRSTRAVYDGATVPTEEIALLAAAAREPGVDAAILTDRGSLDKLRDLVVAGNTAQMEDEAFVSELKSWMRFNPRAAIAAGDGLFSGASGNPSLPDWIGRPLFDLVFTTEAENEKYVRQIDSSAGAVVFSAERAEPMHWARVGRACQRFALKATALGLKLAFINQPVEVPSLRRDLAALADLGDRRPDIVMRFGRGPDLPMSPRRPVENVIDDG